MIATTNSDQGKKNCERCRCPLLLLRLEKRRWENRRICERCGAKVKPSGASIEKLLDEAVEVNGRKSLRSALRALPVVEVTPKKRDKPKHKVQSARPRAKE